MIWIYIAATTAVVISGTHSYLGERRILPRLLASPDLPRLRYGPEFTRAILRWAWHLTSVAWLGFAYLLFLIAARHAISAVELARTIAVIFGFTGLVAFVTTRGKHIGWPLFAVVAIAAWFGVS